MNKKNVVINSILGFIIGDAMGVPVEFVDREKLVNNKVVDMLGYGSYNQPKGSWSDDSSMVIATIKSIIDNKGKIDYKDIMNNFMLWAELGKFTPNNLRFDMGRTTLKALLNYRHKDEFKECENPVNCGLNSFYDNGNGSLMRILPIAIYCYFKKYNDNEIYNLVKDISSFTHRHEISILGCFIYVLFVINLLKNNDKEESYKYIRDYDYKVFFSNDSINVYKRLLLDDISLFSIDSINSSGYIVDTLEAVIWCFMNSNNYNESIIKAINLGDDTDTIEALVGGLSGIYYNEVNVKWLNDLLRKDYLIELCNEFNSTLNSYSN